MEAPAKPAMLSELGIQLLLFVDKRPGSREQVRQIREHIEHLASNYPVQLEMVDVSEQPYLAEHFKLLATPSLVKLFPMPQQTLAGSNLLAQVDRWWGRWQGTLQELNQQAEQQSEQSDVVEGETWQVAAGLEAVARSAKLLELADSVFRLEQEITELRAQLQFKDRIIAMLAHDLRNPLTAASLAIETLAMGHDIETGWHKRLTPQLTAKLLKHARTQTRTIDHMITDILQTARGTVAALRMQPQEMDLNALCLDIVNTIAPKCEAKSLQIELDLPEDIPQVHADAERIRQVIINLFDNAIKYTPEAGTIRLSVLHRTTQKVQVSICDTGLGIPEEKQERIFEDRFRLERDELKDGYGIGLSLCQRIVHAHYGRIWVDSVPNQGSCFHFTLPVYRAVAI